MLSILIPARNEQYLEKTIRSVLNAAEGDIEVIAVLDGYIPDPQIHMDDDRVVFIHNSEPIGQRQSINLAARKAKGKYIMKLDAHCNVAKGFDTILARDCEYDMTMIPRMYNLDVITWQPKEITDYAKAVRRGKVTDYMYIGTVNGSLRSLYYPRKDRGNIHIHNKNKLIDEIMCCMGPCFFMHKDRFWELGGCDEGHGGWGQQGVEVACKAWLSGGSLVVNKNTWFSHWFRGGGVAEGHKPGWPYPIRQKQIDAARAYSTDLWVNNKWSGQKRDFEWLNNKFFNTKKENDMIDVKRTIHKKFHLSNKTRANLPFCSGQRYNRNHLAELYNELGFTKGAEIGVRRGRYSEILCKANPKLHLYCIDPWMCHENKYPQDKQDEIYDYAVERLAAYNTTIIRKTSMDALAEIKDDSIDFVFIDGNHHFDWVMMDLIHWTKKVKKGGIISVHDVYNGEVGVVKAVEAYTHSHNIVPWYITKELQPTAYWVNQ